MTAAESAYGGLRVLVVDDKEFIRSIMRRILEGLGVTRLAFAADGHEALGILAGGEPPTDIVFCDLQMPDMDGIELIRHVADKVANRPAFSFVSGKHPAAVAAAEVVARMRGTSVFESISKPISRRAVTGVLDQVLSTLALLQAAPEPAIAPSYFSPTPAEFRAALAGAQFEVHYQPKQNLSTGKFEGFESLVRWRHPDHGLVLPGTFIALAEESDLIGPLTDLVMASVLEQCSTWNAAGFRTKISVNLSAKMLVDLGLPDHLAATALRAGVDPHQLIMEITESGAFGETADSLEILARLHLKGFTLSIDDFGTGYSSIDQLRRVSFSEMKIDRAFVHRCGRDERVRAILGSSVALARSLGMSIVAEGAETIDEMGVLKELGIDAVQGFYVAPPMPAAEAFAWATGHPVTTLTAYS